MLLSCIRSSNHSALAVLFARRTSLCISASFSSAANANDDADADGNNEVYVLQSTSRGEIGKSQLQSQTIPPKQPTSTRRRTRRRTALGQGSNGASSIPSLADFMHRAKVLNQYRNFVRLAQFVDGKDSNSTADGTGDTTTSGECRAALEEVRLSFKMGMKKDVDSLSKTMAFSQVRSRSIVSRYLYFFLNMLLIISSNLYNTFAFNNIFPVVDFGICWNLHTKTQYYANNSQLRESVGYVSWKQWWDIRPRNNHQKLQQMKFRQKVMTRIAGSIFKMRKIQGGGWG